jgi:hypothetical protein
LFEGLFLLHEHLFPHESHFYLLFD